MSPSELFNYYPITVQNYNDTDLVDAICAIDNCERDDAWTIVERVRDGGAIVWEIEAYNDALAIVEKH